MKYRIGVSSFATAGGNTRAYALPPALTYIQPGGFHAECNFEPWRPCASRGATRSRHLRVSVRAPLAVQKATAYLPTGYGAFY